MAASSVSTNLKLDQIVKGNAPLAAKIRALSMFYFSENKASKLSNEQLAARVLLEIEMLATKELISKLED